MSKQNTFHDFDFDGFWNEHEYSQERYVEPAPDDAMVASIEAELGFKLPAAYIDLARLHNGGLVQRCCFPMEEATTWAEDHIAIHGLAAIGRSKSYALCGTSGTASALEDLGYPAIGIVIADTPSGGHDLVMLDYRDCGPQGEPRVVHVDQENDYRITFVAPDFESFIRGLVDEEEYDTSEQDRLDALDMAENASLSPIVVAALAKSGLPQGEQLLRALVRRIIEEKGFFALHADADSHLMYGLMFWLYSQLTTASSFEAFIAPPKGQAAYDPPTYEMMIVFRLVADPYGLQTGGYAQDFVRDWWDASVAAGRIVQTAEGYRYSASAEAELLRSLQG